MLRNCIAAATSWGCSRQFPESGFDNRKQAGFAGTSVCCRIQPMRSHRLQALLALSIVFFSSCDIQPTDVPLSGISSPTPFQPVTEDLPNSPYTGAAPTPLNLPTFTALPP